MEESPIKYVNQGEIYFGDFTGEVRTILGSCVSVVLWHSKRHIGGMCHIVLPASRNNDPDCDARFANCAIQNLVKLIDEYHSSPEEYWVGIYGGGNMFPGVKNSGNKLIGTQNIEIVCKLLNQHGFHITERDIGGEVRRRLSLNMQTGYVNVIDTEMPSA